MSRGAIYVEEDQGFAVHLPCIGKLPRQTEVAYVLAPMEHLADVEKLIKLLKERP
jgi:hypothetical protein